ncbi:hypothetical protein D3C72_2052820 [compost metagenome]
MALGRVDDAEVGHGESRHVSVEGDAGRGRQVLDFLQVELGLVLDAVLEGLRRLDHDFAERGVGILLQADIGRDARADGLGEFQPAVDGLLGEFRAVGG